MANNQTISTGQSTGHTSIDHDADQSTSYSTAHDIEKSAGQRANYDMDESSGQNTGHTAGLGSGNIAGLGQGSGQNADQSAHTRNCWQGRRIRLRAVEPSDGETHFLWNQDTVSYKALDRVHFPQSLVAARQWADKATLGADGDAFHFEIENLAGELVGSIATHACDPRNGTFAYGVAIRAEHQRHGYASEAIRLVLRHYFEELRYQKVTIHVYSFNAASLALHERLGFQREGVLRRMIYTGGAFHDIIVFGLTADEFTQQLSVSAALKNNV